MKVLLKRTWFVEKTRYKKSVPATEAVTIPDHLRDQLPSDAVVVGDDYKPTVAEPVKEPETLAELGRHMQNRSVPEELADAQIDAAKISGQWPPEKKDESDA